MEDSSAFEDLNVSVPCGGPVYVADMVGSLTRVSEFSSSIEDELKDLREELTEQQHHEVFVNKLKMLSEEELVDIAFQASLKGDNSTGDPSPSSEEFSERATDVNKIVVKSGVDEDYIPPNDVPRRSKRSCGNVKKKKGEVSKKTKKVTTKDSTHEDDYMAVVGKLAKIKQKQEEDKLAARLHSFSGTSGPITCMTPSDKKERMSSFKCTSYQTQQVKSSSSREHIPLDGDETLLYIEVFHSQRTWVKTQEIVVLGQQLLSEVRDKIYCLTDEIMKSSKSDPSGYFLIEDIFFDDLRDANATDYSKPILDWFRESKEIALEKWESIVSGELQQKQKEYLGKGSGPELPRFRSLPMHTTRFCDLSFRRGAGYIYCHQGACKHTLVIRDMRLCHAEDVHNRAAYPLVVYQTKVRFQKCSCCKINKAIKVTVDDKWAGENPCFFCGICYYMLHYNDNKLMYDDFKVYDYIHD